MVCRIPTVQESLSSRDGYKECFIITRTGYYVGKHEEMKVKHKGLTIDDIDVSTDEQAKITHERMKGRHKEPPWVACPYCGEKL